MGSGTEKLSDYVIKLVQGRRLKTSPLYKQGVHWLILFFVLIVTSIHPSIAQTPIITPKPSVVLKLNSTGTYNVSLNDVAIVTSTDNNTPIVTLSPASFDCSALGKQTVTVIAANSSANPSAASFYGPGSILMDPGDNLFVSDIYDGLLRYIQNNGQSFTLDGSNGPYSSSTGMGYNFAFPAGIARDNSGNIYVAVNNQSNYSIVKLTPSGVFTTMVISNSMGLSTDGPKGVATVYVPLAMVCDDNGNVYFTEIDHKVRKLAPDGSITTIAGSLQGYSGTQDGVGTNALFLYPEGITIDKANNLYVTDRDGFDIRKITPAGVVTTIAGGTPGFADGTGLNAKFGQLDGITIDNAGNLYVADAGNFAVRKVTPAGIVTTIAGNGAEGYQDGPGNQAMFGSVYNVAVDSKGNVYVSDLANDVVRKIDTQGIVTTFAGSGQQGGTNGNVLESNAVSVTVPVTVEGSITITTPLPDVSLHLSSSCPTVLPDYTKNIAVTDPCAKTLHFSQTPSAGTGITGAEAIPVTITVTDDNGLSTTSSFHAIPDNTPLPLPSLAISASSTSICEGATVIFTAMPANAGNSPIYQWHVNGANAGDDQPTFSTKNLNSTDVINCTITTTGNCPLSATSNAVSVAVNQNLSPSVTISTSARDICSGYNGQFTASGQNAGTNPSFQWQLNGTNVGVNSPNYTNNALANGDLVSCIITNNDPSCLTTRTASSNVIAVTVIPLKTPSVSITSNATGSICSGTAVFFQATPTNAENPTYIWQVNENPVGSNSSNFSSNSLADGDVVSCNITTAGKCVVTPNAISNSIVISIVPAIQTTAVVLPTNATICSEEPLTFTVQTNADLANSNFQWKINGINTGTNSSSFTSAHLKDRDVIICMITPTAGCYIPQTSTGVEVKINERPSVTLPNQIFLKPRNSIRLDPWISGDVASYQWTPATGLDNPSIKNPLASPSVTTTYSLLITSASGCQNTASVTINLQGDISIPNAFTPNGDGINDLWNINGLSNYSNCLVSVYNRYGQLMFNSRGYPKPWDGTINGNLAQTGTYYYIIDLQNGTKPLSGYIAVIR